MRTNRMSNDDALDRWMADALTMIQESGSDSRRVLRLLPPAVFVDAAWHVADVVLAGEWELRMHIVEYVAPTGETYPCAVLDAVSVKPFNAWCMLDWEIDRRSDVDRVRVTVHSRLGRSLNLSPIARRN